MMATTPQVIEPGSDSVSELARDLRWTWSHEADALWHAIEPKVWEKTRNPWIVLQSTSAAGWERLANDPAVGALLERIRAAHKLYLESSTERTATVLASGVPRVAYFSMEFGLGEALPLYAGGLGILAGDVLKTASDLGLPVIGIGLLYQCGYFRQLIDATGWQQESFPYNEPASLPIEPVHRDGEWLRVTIELPARQLRLRVWRARVGAANLYLLDSNDPLNHPVDRGITSQLYGGGHDTRLLQELVLGIGGWRLVEALGGPEIEICHINEGHAAFAVLERARQFMQRAGISFREAFWATRAGNIFTTHTPVDAGFDRYPPELLTQQLQYLPNFLAEIGLSPRQALALGRANPDDPTEPFNMAFLAMRGSILSFGVSDLHATVSRRIFGPLFPRLPQMEVPVSHVTNGVHVPTWDSPWTDELWTSACGRERWRAGSGPVGGAIATIPDERLVSIRAMQRADLVRYGRGRLAWQLAARGADPGTIAASQTALDANVLTLGFARRFTAYKRPNLLLRDSERLARLLSDPHRPVQLVLAGKAHPLDLQGKAMIREWVQFAARPEIRHRVVFLEDYDIGLAQQLVEGVDLWINTPLRPLEACGTSGMKILVNGGLNLSVRDGWWAEAYEAGVGWALDSPSEMVGADRDGTDAQALYTLLEQEVVPEFYDRDEAGIPRRWAQRVRCSMAELTDRFSSNRMMRDYVERAYLPAARHLRQRTAPGQTVCRDLLDWAARVQQHWGSVHIGDPHVECLASGWRFAVPVYLGEIDRNDVRVELYADPADPAGASELVPLELRDPIAGAANGFFYEGTVPDSRPREHYTARVVPAHRYAQLPLELPLILWQR